jgi:molybdate transport system substrate-binding protein
MEQVIQSGRILPGTARIFAANRLAVIVPMGEDGQVETLQDLARPGARLVLPAREVPAGTYALEFLANAARDPSYGTAYEAAVLQNVVSYEDNVKAVLNKVALGEADAGIVYVTDLVGQGAGGCV